MQLYGKTALITGAGQGIGRATAVAFAKEGANLILADINYENAVETANQIAAVSYTHLRAHETDS